MTFVFAYIQIRSVARLKAYIKNRSVRVVLVVHFFLGGMMGVALFIVPEVKNQTEMFIKQFGTYVARLDDEIMSLCERYPVINDAVLQLKNPPQEGANGESDPPPVFSPTTAIVQEIIGMGEEAPGKKITQILDRAQNIGKRLFSIASAFFLSLLFSFLIVFDLPSLSHHVKSLEKTKLRFIYEEVADGIYNFSKVLGQAFEAQFFIALLNTFFTAIGVVLMGLVNHVAFLSTIVFICSFIPVVGVFVSSLPICLIALQMIGPKAMVFSIMMIIIIHLIEGYILNPRIYGSRMRINPVIVLFILTISGKLFHIWGLILGIPVFSYIFSHAIQYASQKEDHPEAMKKF